MASPVEAPTLPGLEGDLVAMLNTVLEIEANQANPDLDQMEHSLILARCRVRTLKNAQRPANRLAPEVLAQIFVHLDALRYINVVTEVAGASAEQIKALLTITQVCRQWRYVAFSSPNLWNHIHIRHPADQLAIRALTLSGQMPLVIYQFGDHQSPCPSPATGPHAFEMAMEHCHRIEQLYIVSMWKADCTYWRALDREAPMLRTLRIISSGSSSSTFSESPPLPELFKGSHASLEHLCLEPHTLFGGNQFKNLKSLILHEQDKKTPENQGFSEFLAALSLSPQLEELVIGRSYRHSGSDIVDSYFLDNPIRLPKLRILALGCWNHITENVSGFLDRIQIPDSASRYVFASSWSDWTISLTDLVQKGRIAASSPTRNIRRLRMVASRTIDGSYGFAFEGDTLTFTSNIDSDNASLRLAFLNSGLLSDVEELVLVLSPTYPPTLADYQSIFSALPSIHRLSIAGELRLVLPRITEALGLTKNIAEFHEPCVLLDSLDFFQYPQSTKGNDGPIDALLISWLAERRAKRGHPLQRVLVERGREDQLKQLRLYVDDVSSVRRWEGRRGYQWEETFLKDIHARTRTATATPFTY